MTEILKQHLENGKIVRLGDFGSFQIGISSEGTESKEKFQPSLIKKPRVIFRQGIGTKEMLRNIEYEKIEN
jgi:predicted histone-like DNA-binding protein